MVTSFAVAAIFFLIDNVFHTLQLKPPSMLKDY